MRHRRALTVGINRYRVPGNDLRGCVNDAVAWAEVLGSVGYDVGSLFDEFATKDRVLGRLRELVAQARFGDRIVFTYSGHGSYVLDVDGDEPDRRDEVLVTHDFQVISDDELHEVFARRRFGVRVVIISDSCHSGTMQRFSGLPTVGERARHPRFLDPELLHLDEAPPLVRPRGAPYRPATALLAGCSDTEFSYDAWIDGRPQGAFTAAAIAAWHPAVRLAEWHRSIRAVLPSSDFPQSPQLQATSSQRRWSL